MKLLIDSFFKKIITNLEDGIVMAVRAIPYQMVQHSAPVSNVGCCSKILDTVLTRNAVTKRREFHLIPEAVEKFLGASMYPSMISSQGGRYAKHGYQDMVQRVGQKISPISGRPELPWQFNVIDNNTMNAWCMPGGKIAFYRGLIDQLAADTKDYGVGNFTLEEKVAAVMGHEATHAAARHSARGIEFALVLGIAFAVLRVALRIFTMRSIEQRGGTNQQQRRTADIVDRVLSPLSSLIRNLATMHGSRSKEFEADKYGMVFLKRAGYDPKAALWLQKFFIAQHPKSGTFLDTIANLFRSHPYSEARFKENEKTLALINNGQLV